LTLAVNVPHVVTAPHRVAFSGMWWATCTCGAEALATDADGVRTELAPHRAAEKERLGGIPNRERDEARRLRRESRREQTRQRATKRGAK